MTSQLLLYRGAALHLGERRVVALDDEGELVRALDDVWEDGELVTYLLSQGQWNFATRTVELTYSPSMTQDFGPRYGFDRPVDWVRTTGVSADADFQNPLPYKDESLYLFADVDLIYWSYVSKADEYGNSLGDWPVDFTEWAKAYLAYRVAKRVTGSDSLRDDMYALQKRLLTEARSRDAMNEAIAYPPTGSWVNSRGSGYSSRRSPGR